MDSAGTSHDSVSGPEPAPDKDMCLLHLTRLFTIQTLSGMLGLGSGMARAASSKVLRTIFDYTSAPRQLGKPPSRAGKRSFEKESMPSD